MGKNNREIEAKLLVDGCKKLSDVVAHIEKLLNAQEDTSDMIIGNAADIYWKAPDSGIGDFTRLRRKSSTTTSGQITIKSTDRGDNIDRVEVDLDVDDYRQAKILMLSMLGDPMATVTKKYHVYFLKNIHENVSIYQVKDDDRVFVEIEATSRRRLRNLIKLVVEGSVGTYTYKWIRSSVFNMFVEKKDMDWADVSSLMEKDK